MLIRKKIGTCFYGVGRDKKLQWEDDRQDIIAWRPLLKPYERKARLIKRMDEDGIRYQCDNCLHIMEDYETSCKNCGAKFLDNERKE